MKYCLLVMLGGGIGAVLRYIVTVALNNWFNLRHWGTFVVNMTGCFLIGLMFGYLIKHSYEMYVFVIVGMIGSYTTFSTFEYENIDLIAHEKYIEFLNYAVLSCAIGFLAVFLGALSAKAIM